MHLKVPGDLKTEHFQSLVPDPVYQGPKGSINVKIIEISQFSLFLEPLDLYVWLLYDPL